MFGELMDSISAPQDKAALCPRCGGLILPACSHRVADCLTITAARLAALEELLVRHLRERPVSSEGLALLDNELAAKLTVKDCPFPRPIVKPKP